MIPCNTCGTLRRPQFIEGGDCDRCRLGMPTCPRCQVPQFPWPSVQGMCDWCHRECSKSFRHGITIGQAERLLAGQGGRCAICPRPILLDSPGNRTNVACVDHDHRCCPGNASCGKCVRGLLCTSCNTALGLFRDDVAILKSAVAYLDTAAKLSGAVL